MNDKTPDLYEPVTISANIFSECRDLIQENFHQILKSERYNPDKITAYTYAQQLNNGLIQIRSLLQIEKVPPMVFGLVWHAYTTDAPKHVVAIGKIWATLGIRENEVSLNPASLRHYPYWIDERGNDLERFEH